MVGMETNPLEAGPLVVVPTMGRAVTHRSHTKTTLIGLRITILIMIILTSQLPSNQIQSFMRNIKTQTTSFTTEVCGVHCKRTRPTQ